MVERTPIFNAKGFQLGYIEGNAVFDFNGTQRCSYARATGNLCALHYHFPLLRRPRNTQTLRRGADDRAGL